MPAISWSRSDRSFDVEPALDVALEQERQPERRGDDGSADEGAAAKQQPQAQRAARHRPSSAIEVAEAAARLDDVRAELLAQAHDQRLERIGIAASSSP